MKIFVTGGAGFLGTALVSRLLSAGHQVAVYDNLAVGSEPPSEHHDLTFFQSDILDEGQLHSAMDSFHPESVVHLAALHFIPACNARPVETQRINVEGTLRVMLAATRTQSVKSVVFASSGAVYGRDDAFHQETDPLAPTDIYGLSKMLGEQVVRHYADLHGIAAISLRFANLFGPGETNPHVLPEIIRQLQKGATLQLGRTDTFRDFLYVDDAASMVEQAILHAETTGDSDVFNAGSGVEHSIAEVLTEIEALVGSPLCVNSVSDRIRPGERIHLRLDRAHWERVFGQTKHTGLQDGLLRTLAAYGIPATTGTAA